MGDNLDGIIESQAVIKFLEVEHDRNGQIIEKAPRSKDVVDFISEFGTADPGGAADISLIEIEVAAGDILEIYHVIGVSETGAKPIAIATASVTFAAPLSGEADYSLKFAALITGTQIIADEGKKPFLVFDNSQGVATLFVHVIGMTGFMDTVQATTEDLAAFISGISYTP